MNSRRFPWLKKPALAIGKLFSIAMTIFLSSAVFCYSIPAYAGIFSFLDGILTKKEIAVERFYNSQNISLLKADFTPDTSYGLGGGDITIVNESALLSEFGPLGTSVDISEDKNIGPDKISLYVVREGDNVSQIAGLFSVSANTILWANDLQKGETIKPGQILVILPISGIQYTIKGGDTPQSIAKKFNAIAEDIIAFNNLDPKASLKTGENIVIPHGEYLDTSQTSSSQKPSSTISKQKSTGPIYAGYYLKPVEGAIRSQGLHAYNAVDLANSCGTPVMAAATGDVFISRSSGWNGGYGNYVVISHPNGTQTLYAHLSKSIVSTGWHVVKGQIIGYIGVSGRSTGCHVHFEIRGAKNPF